jgi:hypothetical protein
MAEDNNIPEQPENLVLVSIYAALTRGSTASTASSMKG